MLSNEDGKEKIPPYIDPYIDKALTKLKEEGYTLKDLKKGKIWMRTFFQDQEVSSAGDIPHNCMGVEIVKIPFIYRIINKFRPPSCIPYPFKKGKY